MSAGAASGESASDKLHAGSAREWLETWETLTVEQRKTLAQTIDLDFETGAMAGAMCPANEVNDVRCRVNNVLDSYTDIEIDVDSIESPWVGTMPSGAVSAWTGGILSAEEALADEIPEVLVDRLVHRYSITTVTGASKAGKSMLMTQAAMNMATGSSFIGLQTRRALVLYISLEMTAALMVDRMQSIARDTGTPMPNLERDFLLWAPTANKLAALDLLRMEGRDRLRTVIEESSAEVVVLDTLYRFALGADPNANAEMQPLFSDIADIAQKTGAAIVIIDHAGKGQHDGPVSHSAIGASIKGGASRTIAALKREGDGWSINVESHFGNWESPISYTRPTREDGSKGFGCVRSSAAEVRGIDLESVRRVFLNYGEGDPLVILSQRKLIDALKAEGLIAGDSRDAGQAAVTAVVSSFGCDKAAESRIRAKFPVWFEARSGPRNATRYEWNEPVFKQLVGVAGVAG